MRILIVKLSSLGDVIHAMAAAQDMMAALPHAQVDWVVEKSFAPLLARCQGLRQVITCEIRRWRQSPLSASTIQQWRAFKAELQRHTYDAIIDLQGLTKSAVVSRLALLSPGGRRYAMANRTDGSSYEAPSRWLADVAIRIEPHVHAVYRSRLLCARALGYDVPEGEYFGLKAADLHDGQWPEGLAPSRRDVVFAHGTSRADKLWPDANWVTLGRRLQAHGLRPALAHGTTAERQRSGWLADHLPGAVVWPRLPLDEMVDAVGSCAGLIGVDSGLSHLAVAMDMPHVQIYNFDTAWRTGPVQRQRQLSVFDQPTPSVDQVWRAWSKVYPS